MTTCAFVIWEHGITPHGWDLSQLRLGPFLPREGPSLAWPFWEQLVPPHFSWSQVSGFQAAGISSLLLQTAGTTHQTCWHQVVWVFPCNRGPVKKKEAGSLRWDSPRLPCCTPCDAGGRRVSPCLAVSDFINTSLPW